MANRTRLPNEDHFTQLDHIMKEYCQLCINKGFNFNSLVIRAKAKSEAAKLGIIGFKASRTWFQKFAMRNNLTYARISGESKSVDDSIVANFIASLPEKLSNYSPDEIYNADETGLQYKSQNNYSYSFETKDRHGTKILKNHVSLLLCTSLSGIKRKPLIIGTAKKPRCFAEINYDLTKYNVDYASSKKGYMNNLIWQKWLIDWDRELIKEDKKVLLFIDNCPCHNHLPDLTKLKVEFFPSNCTSKCQPLDAGIIANFKNNYRNNVCMLMSRLITTDVNELINSINCVHVVEWTEESWIRVKQLTITNCYEKCGFILKE